MGCGASPPDGLAVQSVAGLLKQPVEFQCGLSPVYIEILIFVGALIASEPDF